MLKLIAALLAGTLVLAIVSGRPPASPVLAQAMEIVVTSASDETGPDAACPSDEMCTLRAAIAAANAVEGDDDVRIAFDPEVFPEDEPATIEVLADPLPEVTRANVSIEATLAGVVVDGSQLDDEATGLSISGDTAVVRGIALQNFDGPCLSISGADATIGGDREAGGGNTFDGCTTGIAITGEGALVRGNLVGYGDGEGATEMAIGIHIAAADATIGGEGIAGALSNYIGNVTDGVLVGDAGDAFEGVLIAGNVVGRAPGGARADVVRGITIAPSSGETQVVANTIAFAEEAAISLPTAAESVQTAGNNIRANVFADLGGLEIDLGGDGMRNANDPDDADSGPNGLRNHPNIKTPTQAVISGTACSACTIEFYRSHHPPGGGGAFATVPFASVTASVSGSFSLSAPPVVPGDWITATATDPEGNTSEFAPTTRIGVGAIQCGNVALHVGWNHAGYFGTSTVALGNSFPGDNAGAVTAVYQLRDDGSYAHWFRDASLGRTLTSLTPGSTYWFLAEAPFVIRDGFSITSPLGARLHAGWNDFVYFGAGDDAHDALATILDAGTEVYAYQSMPDGGEWAAWGSLATPGFARQFTEVQPCEAYMVWVDEAAVLTPLHP